MPPGGQKIAMAMAIWALSLASALLTTTAVVDQDSPNNYVELHNAVRAVAGAGAVAWDDELARRAGIRAAAGCGRSAAARSAAGGYGGNVFHGPPGKACAAVDAVLAWTAEAAPENAQVVWPGSTKIGCARVVCGDNRGVIISCSYEPAVEGRVDEGSCSYNL
ncbi:hypothetical protein ACP70R_001610 [Stipagrostis hirtigluma subsp. patula]